MQRQIVMMKILVFFVVLLLLTGVHAPLLTRTRSPARSCSATAAPPGTFLRARCTSAQKSECVECPSGSFTELWNYIGKCLRCGVCGYNQVVKSACRPDSDCQCECKPGYHMKKFDMCFRHSECQTGQEVLTKDDADCLKEDVSAFQEEMISSYRFWAEKPTIG